MLYAMLYALCFMWWLFPGYPEGHPNRISQVDSLDDLTPEERGRAGAIRGEHPMVLVEEG